MFGPKTGDAIVSLAAVGIYAEYETIHDNYTLWIIGKKYLFRSVVCES